MKNNNVNLNPTARNKDQKGVLEGENLKQEQKFIVIFFRRNKMTPTGTFKQLNETYGDNSL